jgi:hypothetical protein
MNWATVTVTDSTGKRYSLDVEAESTYDAAHLFLTKAKEHVIREPLPIPSLETVFEVSVNGRVHMVPGSKLQKWILKPAAGVERATRDALQPTTDPGTVRSPLATIARSMTNRHRLNVTMRIVVVVLATFSVLNAPSGPRPLQVVKVLTAAAMPLDSVPRPVDLSRIGKLFGIRAAR